VGISCADHVTPSTRKSRHYFADSGGRSVGIVRCGLRPRSLVLVSFSFSKASGKFKPVYIYAQPVKITVEDNDRIGLSDT
jgi:hypothetical protein